MALDRHCVDSPLAVATRTRSSRRGRNGRLPGYFAHTWPAVVATPIDVGAKVTAVVLRVSQHPGESQECPR